jgi:hypothetical protein
MHQVHGSAVVQATARTKTPPEADGLWTQERGVVLAALAADCVPILLANHTGDTVAAVHAGWRGTAARVGARAVACLQANAGVAPAHLFAAVGPAIGPCCFVVGGDAAAALRRAFEDAPVQAFRPVADRLYVDLWALNQRTLEQAGILAEHIAVVRRCTFCTRDYFSYRRDAGATGRQAGVIGVRA